MGWGIPWWLLIWLILVCVYYWGCWCKSWWCCYGPSFTFNMLICDLGPGLLHLLQVLVWILVILREGQGSLVFLPCRGRRAEVLVGAVRYFHERSIWYFLEDSFIYVTYLDFVVTSSLGVLVQNLWSKALNSPALASTWFFNSTNSLLVYSFKLIPGFPLKLFLVLRISSIVAVSALIHRMLDFVFLADHASHMVLSFSS